MIFVYEPLCKGLSHEKVNSGFLYGLSLAFPEEKIRLYADQTHITAIQSILIHDDVKIDGLEFSPIFFKNKRGLSEVFQRWWQLKNLFSIAKREGVKKIFFLSFNAESLYVIKKLNTFFQLKFTFVLHGDFENVANWPPIKNPITFPIKSFPIDPKSSNFFKKIRGGPKEIIQKIIRKFSLLIQRYLALNFSSQFFSLKKIIEYKNSEDFRYIVLSRHIQRNLDRFFDLSKIQFEVVTLPTKFRKVAATPLNEHAKFAVFGHGDSIALLNVATLLLGRRIDAPYEIRIIGMDSRAALCSPHITTTTKGNRLERSRMEELAIDIDIFLILYDESKYRLSCSGSILEAISLGKPVIHFDNQCVNEFNYIDAPIGYSCKSMNEFLEKMEYVIKNYASIQNDLQIFRDNIYKNREKISIESSAPQIKRSFTW